MPRSDFATSAQYHADAAIRAADLLNSQIARIDSALSFMAQRKAVYLPATYKALRDNLIGVRNNALRYLGKPDNGGDLACGMMGPNGYGPKIDALIESVDRMANRARYVPPALRSVAA
ncbi:hypothetical protein [Sphingobium yanoikuyae]|uniref:Uncharacterized protein n=1 Tax=Sphingobium yanoikuyae TaxID=13690 RepID=A0A430BZA7_SPHYA|nr:hypothetical protein [Sphingobium yanoikuyae]RSU58041.1 hypothetical protein DAH51_07300 [Sphingobium yanoikuyae]